MSVNVCIFGVSGYTGSTLLRLLDKHKSVNLVGVFGNKTLGKKIRILFPKLSHLPNIQISDFKKFNFDKVDYIYLEFCQMKKCGAESGGHKFQRRAL